eukprot:scaffold46473_cov64-Phaeocystis_antarctica.AAC.3
MFLGRRSMSTQRIAFFPSRVVGRGPLRALLAQRPLLLPLALCILRGACGQAEGDNVSVVRVPLQPHRSVDRDVHHDLHLRARGQRAQNVGRGLVISSHRVWVIRLAATHGDDTFVVLGPAEAGDPLSADLVGEDRVDVDREAIGRGVNHAINKPARLQVDCQLLQVQILRLLGEVIGVRKLALLGADLIREGAVLPVNL